MNRSYYENFQTLNTFMKWILVVIMCFGADCQTIYEQHLYDKEQDCLNEAGIVSAYAQKQFPNSSGQVYCLTTDEFQSWFAPSTTGA